MQHFVRRAVARLKTIEILRTVVARARTIGFSRQKIAQGRARKLIEIGNLNAAAAQLEHVEVKSIRTWRMLLDCYFTAHHFEKVIQGYQSMPQDLQRDLACRHLYLSSAANLKHFNLVASVFQDVLDEPESLRASSFLSKVRPLAEQIGPAVHAATVKRIVSHGDLLVEEQFDAILKCAHDLRERNWRTEADALEGALRRIANDARRKMKIDIYDAQVEFWSGHFDRQLAAVNKVLTTQSIEPLALKDEGLPLSCDNLMPAVKGHEVIDGPVVSILMPAYNSADTILHALESLQGQTYRNLEVIVVDDASSDETSRIAARFCATDPRFRLLSLDRNSGAFIARNRALALAKGELVTNQDADDWAHPQKIATAVAELQRDQSVVATWVEHVRCSKQRGFRALNGYFRPDASSLMFRREPVMRQIGWYDSVRAAGDGEFHLRMERAFGRASIRRINKLLSFVGWSDTSLSGGGAFQIDSDLGLFSPDRSAYRRSFGLWHETTDRLFMPFPLERRPFPAPEKLVSLDNDTRS
jgi:hypothetical protein